MATDLNPDFYPGDCLCLDNLGIFGVDPNYGVSVVYDENNDRLYYYPKTMVLKIKDKTKGFSFKFSESDNTPSQMVISDDGKTAEITCSDTFSKSKGGYRFGNLSLHITIESDLDTMRYVPTINSNALANYDGEYYYVNYFSYENFIQPFMHLNCEMIERSR